MALRKKKTLLDQASDYIDQVRPQVEAAVATALDAAEEFYENTARPALVDAKDKAGAINYVIDGKIENLPMPNRFISGTWKSQRGSGAFRIQRQSRMLGTGRLVKEGQ